MEPNGKQWYLFSPTDDVLVGSLLYERLLTGQIPDSWPLVHECDIYCKEEPWQIWQRLHDGDNHPEQDLYCFTTLKRKGNGSRIDRTIGCGCWHEENASSIKANAFIKGDYIALKRRFTYLNRGSAQNGLWFLFEYSLKLGNNNTNLVLCRLRKNGKRKGADVDFNRNGNSQFEKRRRLTRESEIESCSRVERETKNRDHNDTRTEIAHTPGSRTGDRIQIGNSKNKVGSWDSWNNWSFRGNENVNTAVTVTARSTLGFLMQHANKKDQRPVVDLSDIDPAIPGFRTSLVAENAVVNALQSANFNNHAPLCGLYSARSAVAEYLSRDLPYQISPSDVYITAGFRQALEVIATVLAAPGANILLPRPGFPNYAAQFRISCLELRYYNLLPQRNWEIDLATLEDLADKNTAAIVINNPGNPCGSVFSSDHLKKIAEAARRLGILAIADEVYAQFTFGSKPFVPMATFGSIAPVVTVGSVSKKWFVPGWPLGWLVTCDPHGNLQKSGIVQHISACLRIISPPVTFLQGALPKLLQEREGTFFVQHMKGLRKSLDILYNKTREIACITWSQKPEGATCGMVKLDLPLLEGVQDDIDFCIKLAQEESVLVLPGCVVGMKNWLCLSFALDRSTIEDGLGRVKSFCQRRHAKQGEVLSARSIF